MNCLTTRAFHGETPDEKYFGTGSNVPNDLNSRKNEARAARLAANRAVYCEICEPTLEAS